MLSSGVRPQVLDSSDMVQTDWAICFVSSVDTEPGLTNIYNTTWLITPPTTQRIDGNFKLRLSGVTSGERYINTFLVWNPVTGGSTLNGRLTFHGAAVSGISTSDFEVINESGTIQSDWDITSVSTSSVSAGQHVDVVATPPDNIFGDFRIRLKANSVTRNSSNYPSSPVHSQLTFVDDRFQSAPVATASWSHVTGGSFLRGRITFTGGYCCIYIFIRF